MLSRFWTDRLAGALVVAEAAISTLSVPISTTCKKPQPLEAAVLCWAELGRLALPM
jgi:hypothetical protein